MELKRNMATVIRALKEESGKSTADFSVELEVSRSTLQKYLSGQGNPNLSTVEHLAEKLGIDASFLISSNSSEDQLDILLKLLETLKLLSGLSIGKRQKFAQLLLEMVSLWDDSDAGS